MAPMSLRHAAALALLSWYLVAPGRQTTHDYMGGALFSRWYRLGVFETGAQCDQALRVVQARVAKAFEKERLSAHRLTFQFGVEAECDDDPAQSNLPEATLKLRH
jgi:hypothetical protein